MSVYDERERRFKKRGWLSERWKRLGWQRRRNNDATRYPTATRVEMCVKTTTDDAALTTGGEREMLSK